MLRKLYIYDRSSEIDREQADGRFDESDNVHTLPVSSIRELETGLSGLVSKMVFDRVLFQTHGSPGAIYFNHQALDATVLRNRFSGKNYHTLFPHPSTRIYFDGCNVAEGEPGTKFLMAVGEVFLRGPGGFAFGWKDYGRGIAGWVPFVGGHTLHIGGSLKKLRFRPGGVLIPDPPFKWPDEPPGSPAHSGNRV